MFTSKLMKSKENTPASPLKVNAGWSLQVLGVVAIALFALTQPASAGGLSFGGPPDEVVDNGVEEAVQEQAEEAIEEAVEERGLLGGVDALAVGLDGGAAHAVVPGPEDAGDLAAVTLAGPAQLEL